MLIWKYILINLVDLNDHAVGHSDNHIDHDGHEVDLGDYYE